MYYPLTYEFVLTPFAYPQPVFRYHSEASACALAMHPFANVEIAFFAVKTTIAMRQSQRVSLSFVMAYTVNPAYQGLGTHSLTLLQPCHSLLLAYPHIQPCSCAVSKSVSSIQHYSQAVCPQGSLNKRIGTQHRVRCYCQQSAVSLHHVKPPLRNQMSPQVVVHVHTLFCHHLLRPFQILSLSFQQGV